MKRHHSITALVTLACLPAAAADCDLGKYRAQEGLAAAKQADALLVSWVATRALTSA